MVLVTLSTQDELYRLMIAPGLWLGSSYSLTDSYELSQSINMVGFSQAADSIGHTDTGNGFQGSFDGKGYTITIGTVVSTYNGLFYFTQGSISNLTVIYNIPGTTIIGTAGDSVGSLVSGTIGTVTNCHVILPDNITIGQATSFDVGGLIGITTNTIDNCTLVAGDNLTIISNNFVGGFIGRQNGGLITNCTSTVGNNCSITGFDVGGLTGVGFQCNNCNLTFGNNCSLISNNGYIGGIIGDSVNNSSTTIYNISVIYGDNTTISGGNYTGGVGGGLYTVSNINNCIVMYRENTNISGGSRVGGIVGLESVDSNVFGLFLDYSIIASGSSGPIYPIPPPIIPASIITNTSGSPLPGSEVTTMSTTLLNNVINYVNANPFLAPLVPYIILTYGPKSSSSSSVNIEICPCGANLTNSNPQNTNYNESEDKSRMADQIVRGSINEYLDEMIMGRRTLGVPIFKSYQEMMMWKQGALKYRR
jgi:hypothetical protein